MKKEKSSHTIKSFFHGDNMVAMTKWDRYTNREAAKYLGVEVSTWKRWVRLFLRPVPSEGRQKGKRRMLTRAQVGKVLMGGCLTRFVGVKEAKQILRKNLDREAGLLEIGIVYLGLKLTFKIEMPEGW